jgi:hypothetical protein
VDKHRETHEMLVTQGADVEGLDYSPGAGKWFAEGWIAVAPRTAHALIEHAAILWLMARGWHMSEYADEHERFYVVSRAGDVDEYGDTLIDALHEAVKREVW